MWLTVTKYYWSGYNVQTIKLEWIIQYNLSDLVKQNIFFVIFPRTLLLDIAV